MFAREHNWITILVWTVVLITFCKAGEKINFFKDNVKDISFNYSVDIRI